MNELYYGHRDILDPPTKRPVMPVSRPVFALALIVLVLVALAATKRKQPRRQPAKPVVVPLTEQQERAAEADILRKVKIDHETIRRRQSPSRPEMVQ